MEITLSKENMEKLQAIATMMKCSTEQAAIYMIDKNIDEFCLENGKFSPVKARYIKNDVNRNPYDLGECYILREEQLAQMDCYRIFHNGKITYAFKQLIKIE